MTNDRSKDELLDLLLNELDMQAQQQQYEAEEADDAWTCRRSSPRQTFRTKCIVRFLPTGSWTVSRLEGRTRNLSRGGIGLVVRRMFAPGEAVEVEIRTARHPTMFMGGLVVSCRYVARGFYELGVSLRVAQNKPVFSDDPTAAMEVLDWLQPAGAKSIQS